MRRILVTGATGRLGAATVRRLTEGGLEVRAVSRRLHEGAVSEVCAVSRRLREGAVE
ncbi:NAD-dependent epimerase/dehydratase family protein [Nonomuraea dietziae]|uniref:NAD-dependent epimerase/dehydratase family protein n=1 Tax=Nonomuraea dietziae TaxID=65515 RepID=UPI003441DBAC